MSRTTIGDVRNDPTFSTVHINRDTKLVRFPCFTILFKLGVTRLSLLLEGERFTLCHSQTLVVTGLEPSNLASGTLDVVTPIVVVIFVTEPPRGSCTRFPDLLTSSVSVVRI